ncbi:hypothetical protein VZT92_015621 [Zoarces viviparus]|uniref:C-type lectin domain-containing protein n=1 Tax=Zoarces viviparus TaxID=48416 RepID=A0AAW1EWD0_ZOAVI
MLLFLFFFGLALGAVPPSDDHQVSLQRANCPMFWYSFNGRCYKYVSTRMTWADAELYCVSQRANLVSIHSLEEQNFIRFLIKNFDPAEGRTWIGLSDTQKEGTWMWSDGSAVKFVFWNRGEPNNNEGHGDSETNMLLFLFFFGLALGAVPPSDDHQVSLQRANCPMFWYSFNGRCYKYVSTRMTWADAELYCVSQRANLVSIHSLEEQNFVKSLIKNFDPAEGYTWFGLSDIHKEGTWMWSDGSAVKFVYWSSRQPDNYKGNEDCVITNYPNELKWNDIPCSHTHPFVCASRN